MYEGLDKDDVHNLTIEHTPHFNVTLNDGNMAVQIENEDFVQCEDLKFELQCKATEPEEYKSVLNFTQPAVNMKDYHGMGCRVR